jgi:hypothetical protein
MVGFLSLISAEKEVVICMYTSMAVLRQIKRSILN